MSKNNRKSIDELLESIEEEIVEETIDEPEEIERELKTGFVYDCENLNIRTQPSLDSEIICELRKGSEVMIDEVESENAFYKIYTESSIVGYCLKQYIKLA